jgi:hypothetical protein
MPMPALRNKPSLTSLVAFFLIVAPLVYVLSYAPVVRVCGRQLEIRAQMRTASSLFEGTFSMPVADASLYPAYSAVDWLIDRTPLRGPLFTWAGLWGVGGAFETGYQHRQEPERPVEFGG